MPAAEIAAAVTGFRASLEIVKAMIGLRDEEAFRAKSIELLGTVADSLEKAIEAREAYAEQADKIRALEAKIAKLESARVERAKYELRTLGVMGSIVAMLKRDARGDTPAHWVCPDCLGDDHVSVLQPTAKVTIGKRIFQCARCEMEVLATGTPTWTE
jgi:hypothetical protein